MGDQDRTREDLLEEIARLRRELEAREWADLERRRAEAILKETEARYRIVVDSAPESIVLVGADGRIQSCNPATEQLTGYTAEELEGKFIHELMTIDPQELPRVVEFFQGLLQGEDVEAFELENIRKDGTRHWTSVTLRVLRSGDEPTGVLVISRDLTERKRMEEALRQSEERYRLLFESSPEAITLMGLDGTVLDCNRQTELITGLPPEEMIGRSFTELGTLAEEDMPMYMDVLERLSRGERLEPFVHKSIRNGSEVRWIEVFPSLLKKDGEILAIQVISRDVTERKQTEEALRESEQRYRLHFESVNECIYSLDRDFRVTSVSPSVERLLGYRPDEIVGRIFTELNILAPESFDKAFEDIGRVLAGETIDSTEYVFIARDGTRKVGEASGAPLIRDGKVEAVVSVVRDVTDRKRMEEELRRHRDRLEELVEERTRRLRVANERLQREISERKQAEEQVRRLNEELEERVRERTEELEKAYEELKDLDRMKDEFLSTISHELRTPLTSIRSFSEILLEYADEAPETRKEFLEIIRVESERLTRLINDFLDLSKIEAGRMEYSDDLVSLEAVLHDVVRSQQEVLRRRSLRCSVECASDLPLVFVDRDRIQQVVTNLVGNAIKFSREGGSIRIRAEGFEGRRSGEPAEWVKVSVEDEGIGIDPKDFDIIFDKFRQVTEDTVRDKPKGTGLGLPICREIVHHYGGNIWVESTKGQGSTFFFTLPAASVAVDMDPGSDCVREETAGWKGKTILVVDDNPNIRRLLRYQLQRRGYRILEAADGAGVLEQARKSKIDLITLDLIMPVMNGYDILGLIREDPVIRDIPVLIISMVEDRKRGILMGANEYLVKPFEVGDLIEKVQALLGEGKRPILVVDDEPSVVEVLRMNLERRGYPVEAAYDGDQAIERLKARVPDLVILDVVMPGKNGYEVLEWIRNQPDMRYLPVIVLSAYRIPEQEGRLFSLGIDGYVDKSEGLSALFDKIDAVLVSSAQTAA